MQRLRCLYIEAKREAESHTTFFHQPLRPEYALNITIYAHLELLRWPSYFTLINVIFIFVYFS